MAIIIETTDDFRALRENEEFRAAVRLELLANDLLELPGEFRIYAEENFVSFNEFREFNAATKRNLDSVNKRFDGVDRSIRELTNSVNDLRGSSLEGRMSTRLRQRVARTLGLTSPQWKHPESLATGILVARATPPTY